MSTLANQLVAAEREDLARAIRQLLATPLITERDDPAVFDLIRRRQEPLVKWFDYTCGWSLVVEARRGYARLLKIRHQPDASRPARRKRSGRAPFDRRRYVLLCVTAADLLACPVTTIGFLADRVTQAMAADPALPAFDTTSRSQRMAYVDVLKLLEHHGALQVLDGTTENFVDSSDAKVLYRIDATLLMRLPSAPTGPSRLTTPPEHIPDRFDELLHGIIREQRYGTAPTSSTAAGGHSAPVSDTQRNLWLRHSLARRLFDDPVLYYDDLTDDERAYLASPTGKQILRKAAEQASLLLEERAEGLLLIDPDALATDTTFPDDSSTARVAALLLMETITGPSGGATPEQLAAAASELLRRFPGWAKAYQSTDGAQRLAEDAVAVLHDFHLIEHHAGRVLARPAAWRYRVTATHTPAPPRPRTSADAPVDTPQEEALW